MGRSKEAIEKGLELYRTLLGRHPAVEEEFARTRAWFVGRPVGAGDAERVRAEELASRRHLEWFLLEHPSEVLGGVPAGVLREAWVGAAESPEDEFPRAFVDSRCGAFEVTAVDRAQGIWLRDLFGLGEYPVVEPEAAAEIEAGDLVVGRIFPVGDGMFRLSPAASCFRDPSLVQAVSADAARMRRERRGVMRVEQLELERLFFASPVSAGEESRESAARAENVQAALAAFDAGRAQGRDLEELFAELERDLGCTGGDPEPSGGDVGIPDLGGAVIPDFPWAVGAMIEEFFWERERVGKDGASTEFRSLRLLAEYGRRIGVFENLTARDLLDFAGRWVLDEDRLADADAASDLLRALTEFCRWCDTEHAMPLSEEFAPLCAELAHSLPRLAEARPFLARPAEGPFAPFLLASVGEEVAVLRDPDGVEHRVALPRTLATRLRAGDIVHARVADRSATLGAVYPAVVDRLRKR